MKVWVTRILLHVGDFKSFYKKLRFSYFAVLKRFLNALEREKVCGFFFKTVVFLFLVNEPDSGWYIHFWDLILKILKNLIFMNGYRISFKRL